MSKENKKKKNFFEQIGQDIQKSFGDIQNTFNSLLGIKIEPKKTGNALKASNTPATNNSLQTQVSKLKSQGDSQFSALEQDWNKIYQKLLKDEQNKFDRAENQHKLQHNIRMKRISNENARIKRHLENQKKNWQKKTDNIEQYWEKRENNRDKYHTEVENVQDWWDKTARKSQRVVEGGVKVISKFGWHLEFNLIMILLPILIVVIVLFIILRPLLSV